MSRLPPKMKKRAAPPFDAHSTKRQRRNRRLTMMPLRDRAYWRHWRRDGSPTPDWHHQSWLAGRPEIGSHVRRPAAPMRDPARVAAPRSRGQAMTEYLVLTTTLIFFLLLADTYVAERSIIKYFFDQVGGFYANSAYVACLPLP